MLVPTDSTTLLQALGQYAYASDAPAELASQLQTIPGSTVDRIFTAIEMLYAFRDQIQTDGITVLAQLAGYGIANHWDFPGQPGRMQAVFDSSMGALGEKTLDPSFVQPDPVIAYREDHHDWREVIVPDLDALKLAKRTAVETLLEQHFTAGFTPTTGPIAGKTLQCRDVEDRTNWLTSQAAYLAAVSAGAGAQPGAAFRTADNTTINCTFGEGLQTLLDMASWGKSLFGHSWELKDQIIAAADQTALDAIDITAGWPA